MPSVEASFRRSVDQFFHQPSTRHALRDLSSGRSLVIYCGAGVTIDRTSMGWGGLIAAIFRPDAAAHRDYPSAEDIELLRQHEDPLRLASILSRYGLDRDTTDARL